MNNARKIALYLHVNSNLFSKSRSLPFEWIPYYMYLLQKKHYALYNVPLFNSDIIVSDNRISIPDIFSEDSPYPYFSGEKWFLDEASSIKSNPEQYRALCKIFKGKEYVLELIKQTPLSSKMAVWSFTAFARTYHLLKTDMLYQSALKRKDKKIVFPKTISSTFKESATINNVTGIKDKHGEIISNGDLVEYKNKEFSFSGIVLYVKSVKSHCILRDKINPYMNDFNEHSYFEQLPINRGHSNLLEKQM